MIAIGRRVLIMAIGACIGGAHTAYADGIDDLISTASLGVPCGYYWPFTVGGQSFAWRPPDNLNMHFMVARNKSTDSMPTGITLGNTASDLVLRANSWNTYEAKCPNVTSEVMAEFGEPAAAVQMLVWYNTADFNTRFGTTTAAAVTDWYALQPRLETVAIGINIGAGYWGRYSSGALSLQKALSHELGHAFGLDHTYDDVMGAERNIDDDCFYTSVMSSNHQAALSPTAKDGVAVGVLYNTEIPAGMVRSLFLTAKGSYQRLDAEEAPDAPADRAVATEPILEFALGAAFPNPSDGTVLISYTLARQVPTVLRVYNVAGREVRTLVNQELTAGRREALWDGRDNGGRRVSSGVYFYRLRAGSWQSERKLIVLQK